MRMFHWKKPQVEDFLRDKTDEQAVDEILSWVENPDTRHAQVRAVALKTCLAEVKTIKRRMLVAPWVKTWSATNEKRNVNHFHQEASPLELEVVCLHNPFYLMNTFSVSFEACMDLTRRLGLVLSNESVMYAITCRELHASGKVRAVSIRDAETAFVEHGLVSRCVDVAQVIPFPQSLMRGHPLRNVDLDATPPGKLKKYVKRDFERVARTREREGLQNRIVRSMGNYEWLSLATSLAGEINRLKRIKHDNDAE